MPMSPPVMQDSSQWNRNFIAHRDAADNGGAANKDLANKITAEAFGGINEQGDKAKIALLNASGDLEKFQGSDATKKDLKALVDAAQLGHDVSSNASASQVKQDLKDAYQSWATSTGKNANDMSNFSFFANKELGGSITHATQDNQKFAQAFGEVGQELFPDSAQILHIQGRPGHHEQPGTYDDSLAGPDHRQYESISTAGGHPPVLSVDSIALAASPGSNLQEYYPTSSNGSTPERPDLRLLTVFDGDWKEFGQELWRRTS